MDIRERLQELEEAREMRLLWQEREHFLSRPVINDMSVIGELWQEVAASGDTVRRRKAFIFTVLFFFSPSKLSGGKILRPVMRALAKTTGCTKSVLSHNCEDVVMHYRLYKDFRAIVEEITGTLCAILHRHGVNEERIRLYHENGG